MHLKGPELVKLSTVYNGPAPSLAINDIDSNPFAFMSTISHEVWGYVYFTRGGVPVITSTFELKEGESVNLETGEILSKEETKKLMDEKKKTKNWDNKNEWEKFVISGLELAQQYETGSDIFLYICEAVRRAIPPAVLDELKNFVENGPVEDGFTISPSTRDCLVRCKLAVRVIVKGKFGYQCATYLGHWVLKDKEL